MASPTFLKDSNQWASSWVSCYPPWAGFSRSLSSQLEGAGITAETEARENPGFLVPCPHCGVILAASARIRAMRSWLMRKTNRKLAIWWGERGGQKWDEPGPCMSSPSLHLILASLPPPAYLHHRVVAEAPLGATQYRPSINVNGPSALVGNEEITIVLQLDNTWRK